MAGRIPQGFIDDLLSRTDIVDLIDEYVPLKKAGKNHQARCPFHDERSPSFTVSRDKQFYHCFGCGAHGTALGFLMEYLRMDFVEAVEELASRQGVAVPREDGGAAVRRGPDLYTILDEAARYYARQLREPRAKPAVDYLKGRGMSGEIAAEYGLGFAPPGWDSLLKALGQNPERVEQLAQAGLLIAREGGGHYDRFRDRVMFPIHDPRGRVIGFGGRVLGGGEPKYLNSPETPLFHKGRELYGLHQLRKHCRDPARVLVVEGYMDVLALAQFGIRHAVATLGTATTRDHLERLFRLVPEVVFCFDGDEAGRRAALHALEVALPLMVDGRSVSFLFMPRGEDPDSLVRKAGPEVFDARAATVNLTAFVLEHLGKLPEYQDFDGRVRYQQKGRELVVKLPEGTHRRLLVEAISSFLKLNPRDIDPKYGERPGYSPRLPGRSSGGRRSPSLVRTSLALLLHRPGLARLVPRPSALASLATPGIALLVNVLELLHQDGDLSCGAIIERFRDSEAGRHLAKLASLDLPVPEDGVEAEFLGAIKRLQRQVERHRREALLRADPGALSDAEKAELRRLLAFPDPETG